MIEQIKQAIADAEMFGPSLTHQDWLVYLIGEVERAGTINKGLTEGCLKATNEVIALTRKVERLEKKIELYHIDARKGFFEPSALKEGE